MTQPREPKMHRVVSSNIAAIGYQVNVAQLWVRFRSGDIHVYDRVTLTVFEALRGARSKGRYVANNVTKHFAYRQVA